MSWARHGATSIAVASNEENVLTLFMRTQLDFSAQRAMRGFQRIASQVVEQGPYGAHILPQTARFPDETVCSAAWDALFCVKILRENRREIAIVRAVELKWFR